MGHLRQMERLFLPGNRKVPPFEYLILRPARVRFLHASVEIFSCPGWYGQWIISG
jgi:hypothetical protein